LSLLKKTGADIVLFCIAVFWLILARLVLAALLDALRWVVVLPVFRVVFLAVCVLLGTAYWLSFVRVLISLRSVVVLLFTLFTLFTLVSLRVSLRFTLVLSLVLVLRVAALFTVLLAVLCAAVFAARLGVVERRAARFVPVLDTPRSVRFIS
jgi:hypothetical protein